MKKTITFLLGLLLFTTVYGDDQTPARVELEDVLVVAIGGYSSCGSSNNPYTIGMYEQTKSLLNRLSERTANVKFVIACLRSAAPPSGIGRFVTSEAPQTIQSGNAADLKKAIESLSTEDTPIFMVGHSYGGWLSMYLSTALSNRTLAGLFTIDPISPKGCGPVEVLMGAAGCHQSPRDLDNKAILERTANWLNFFQTEDRWLTSSEIDVAENYHITYDDSHTRIDADDRVWTRIVGVVQKEVGLFRERELQIP